MKRLIYVLLSVLIAVSLWGCSPKDPGSDPGRLKVVCTIFPPYDFVRQVAQDRVELTMLISPGAEVHSFDPTPADIRSIADADLFVCVGGESEAWAETLLGDAKDTAVLKLMDCVPTLTEEIQSSMTRHEAGEPGEEYDEHVWTSPENARAITERIASMLCDLDPENSDFYKKNAADYREKLSALSDEFARTVFSAARRTLIFADRFPLRYFTEQYGLDYLAAFPGCSSETEASAATVAALVDRVRAEQIPVILKIELSSDRIAEAVREATGARIATFYSCHNLSAEDFARGETYLSLMTKNLATLKEALN